MCSAHVCVQNGTIHSRNGFAVIVLYSPHSSASHRRHRIVRERTGMVTIVWGSILSYVSVYLDIGCKFDIFYMLLTRHVCQQTHNTSLDEMLFRLLRPTPVPHQTLPGGQSIDLLESINCPACNSRPLSACIWYLFGPQLHMHQMHFRLVCRHML